MPSFIHAQEAAAWSDAEVEGTAIFDSLNFVRQDPLFVSKDLVNPDDPAFAYFILYHLLGRRRDIGKKDAGAFQFAVGRNTEIALLALALELDVIGNRAIFESAIDVFQLPAGKVRVDCFSYRDRRFFQTDLQAEQLAVQPNSERAADAILAGDVH